jgi:hypothetical protein
VLDMNSIILRNGAREDEGGSGVDASHRLDEIRVPVTVACGELDVPFLIARSRELPGACVAAATASCPGWRTSGTWNSPGRSRTWCLARSAEAERWQSPAIVTGGITPCDRRSTPNWRASPPLWMIFVVG